MDMRTKGFIVGAVALLAVLTLVLCIMGGVFDFGANGEERIMPGLVGLNEETAVSMLDAIDVKYELNYEDSEQSQGLVINQSVEEGQALSKHEKVTLVISNGPREGQNEPNQMVEVPNFIGKTFEQAKQEASNLGLSVIRLADEYSETTEGQIIRQEPEAGTLQQSGDVIRITVSQGPEVEYQITVTAGMGGSVSPKGLVLIKEGESETFVIAANEGYITFEVKVDGEDVGPVEEYTFEDVDSDHTLYVIFKEKDEEPEGPDGVDVTQTPASPSDIG